MATTQSGQIADRLNCVILIGDSRERKLNEMSVEKNSHRFRFRWMNFSFISIQNTKRYCIY